MGPSSKQAQWQLELVSYLLELDSGSEKVGSFHLKGALMSRTWISQITQVLKLDYT